MQARSRGARRQSPRPRAGASETAHVSETLLVDNKRAQRAFEVEMTVCARSRAREILGYRTVEPDLFKKREPCWGKATFKAIPLDDDFSSQKPSSPARSARVFPSCRSRRAQSEHYLSRSPGVHGTTGARSWPRTLNEVHLSGLVDPKNASPRASSLRFRSSRLEVATSLKRVSPTSACTRRRSSMVTRADFQQAFCSTRRRGSGKWTPAGALPRRQEEPFPFAIELQSISDAPALTGSGMRHGSVHSR